MRFRRIIIFLLSFGVYRNFVVSAVMFQFVQSKGEWSGGTKEPTMWEVIMAFRSCLSSSTCSSQGLSCVWDPKALFRNCDLLGGVFASFLHYHLDPFPLRPFVRLYNFIHFDPTRFWCRLPDMLRGVHYSVIGKTWEQWLICSCFSNCRMTRAEWNMKKHVIVKIIIRLHSQITLTALLH